MPAVQVRSALFGLLMIILAACVQEPGSNAILTPEAFAREWTEAWNSHDVDRILTYYADDASFEDVPSVGNGWMYRCAAIR